MNCKHNGIYFFLIATVLSAILVGSAFAGGEAGKTNEQTSKNVETLEGVMSIKEGHGEFLIRSARRQGAAVQRKDRRRRDYPQRKASALQRAQGQRQHPGAV